jgi:hypothetical protein
MKGVGFEVADFIMIGKERFFATEAQNDAFFVSF